MMYQNSSQTPVENNVPVSRVTCLHAVVLTFAETLRAADVSARRRVRKER